MARLTLKRKESFPDGWHATVRSQLETAVARLAPGVEDFDEGIHDARTSCKKVRAALRLVRDEIGTDVYRKENAHFRDIARRISAIRDARVLLSTMEELRKDGGEFADSDAVRAIESILRNRMSNAESTMRRERDVLDELQGKLGDGAARLAKLKLRDSFDSVAGGLRRVYKSGREDCLLVHKKLTIETFHDWRKRTKYLRYQMAMLKVLWPGPMTAFVEELKVLSDLQGLEHDLAIFAQTLRSDPELKPHAKQAKPLLAEVARRRKKLQKKCLPIGVRLYAETPRRFLERMEIYWKAWRDSE